MAYDSDKQWEDYGKVDPYFGVLSEERYRTGRLTPENLEAFFQSGAEHCRRVLDLIHRHIQPGFAPRKILDYGCGVGRLAVPFARMADTVTGVDISPSMLAEARQSCDARRLTNVSFHTVADLDTLAPDFDLAHSFIVFQHIPPRQGETLFARILNLLRPGGLAAIHVPCRTASLKARIYSEILPMLPLAHNLWNLIKRRPWAYPIMRMYNYDLFRLLEIAHRQHTFCRHAHFLNEGPEFSHKSVILFLQKTPSEQPGS